MSDLLKLDPADGNSNFENVSGIKPVEDKFRNKIKFLEKQVQDLTKDNCHLNARIRGYQTLSQLLEEAKRELRVHKQRNSELQQKLDSLSLESDQLIHDEQLSKEQPKEIMDGSHSTFSNDNSNVSKNTGPAKTQNESNQISERTNSAGVIEEHMLFQSLSNIKQSENQSDIIKTCTTPAPSSGASFVVLSNSKCRSESPSSSDFSLLPNQSLINFPSELTESQQDVHQHSVHKSNGDELAEQVKHISDALQQICDFPQQSTLAPELAKLVAETIQVEKQLKMKKILSDNLVSDYEKIKAQRNIILPNIQVENSQLKQDNEKLLKRVNSLEKKITRNKGDKDHSTYTKINVTEAQEERNEDLRIKMKSLEDQNRKLVEVTKKWDHHFLQEKSNYEKEIEELRRKNYELISKIEQIESANDQLDDIKKLEKEKKVLTLTVTQEMRRREMAESEKSYLQNRIQVLESQLLLYKDQLQSSNSGQMKQGSKISSNMEAQIRLMKQQIAVYQEDFEKERSDRERLKYESDRLKADKQRAQKDLKLSIQKVRLLEEELRMLRLETQKLRELALIQSCQHGAMHNPATIIPQPTTLYHPIHTWTPPQGAWHWNQATRKWSCSRCTYDNEPIRSNCELCGAAKSTGVTRSATEQRNNELGSLESDIMTGTEVQRCVEECDNLDRSHKEEDY